VNPPEAAWRGPDASPHRTRIGGPCRTAVLSTRATVAAHAATPSQPKVSHAAQA